MVREFIIIIIIIIIGTYKGKSILLTDLLS